MSKKNVVRLIFVLTGLLLLTLAYILNINNDLISNIMKYFAIVLLSIVLIDAIWSTAIIYIKNTKLSQLGVSNVYTYSSDIKSKIPLIDLIKKTNNNIDLLGLSLSYIAFNEEIINTLRKRIISGVEVRAIVMSPDHSLLEETLTSQNFLYPTDIKQLSKRTIDIFQSFQYDLKNFKNVKGKFTFLSEKTRPISMSLRRFDDILFVVHYMWNISTHNTPVYLIKGKNRELFKLYLDSFEDQFLTLLNQ